ATYAEVTENPGTDAVRRIDKNGAGIGWDPLIPKNQPEPSGHYHQLRIENLGRQHRFLERSAAIDLAGGKNSGLGSKAADPIRCQIGNLCLPESRHMETVRDWLPLAIRTGGNHERHK
ncbi:MAG: hypothetical protein ACJAWY_003138, partial [Sphingomonas echinoides]